MRPSGNFANGFLLKHTVNFPYFACEALPGSAKLMKTVRLLLVLLLLFNIAACRRSQTAGNQVQVRLAQDPESLNPVSYTSKDAMQLVNLLYQSLLTVDLADGQLKPLLASQMPQVTQQDSLSFFTYTIRPEATWANGSPVTAADVAFTLKVLKSPLVNNEKVRPNFEFISDIRFDAANAKKFTLVCEGATPEHLLITGDFFILPAYLYDPQNLLKDFTLPQLTRDFEALTQNAKIRKFADSFNSADFTRNPKFLQGSAGYQLTQWQTGQTLQFTRKPDWWGNNISEPVSHLTASPEKITFRIIPDNAAALFALKNRQLDVWQNVPAPTFEQLKNDQQLAPEFQFFTPQTYTFTYLGFNARLPKFADKYTRQAIAHLLDLDAILKVTQHNFAVKTIGPVSPAAKNYYNRAIEPFTYNLEQTQTLLQKAGWQKNDRGWTRKTGNAAEPLSLQITYNGSAAEMEGAALILQQEAQKIGIPVTLQPLEGGVMSKALKQGNFEVFFRSMTGNPFTYNFQPILHTSSAGPDGLNYTAFGTPESDKIIAALYDVNSEPEKVKLLKRLQEILHEESNLVFLYFLQDRIAVREGFTNLKISGIKPGYDVSAFKAQQK